MHIFYFFFPLFLFILLQTVNPLCLRMPSLSRQRVGVTAVRGETSLQIPALGAAR